MVKNALQSNSVHGDGSVTPAVHIMATRKSVRQVTHCPYLRPYPLNVYNHKVYTATCQRMYSKYEPVGDIADSTVAGRALQMWEES